MSPYSIQYTVGQHSWDHGQIVHDFAYIVILAGDIEIAELKVNWA